MAEAAVQPDYKIGPEILEKISRLAMVIRAANKGIVLGENAPLGFDSFRGSGSKESKRTIKERQKQGHSVIYGALALGSPTSIAVLLTNLGMLAAYIRSGLTLHQAEREYFIGA